MLPFVCEKSLFFLTAQSFNNKVVFIYLTGSILRGINICENSELLKILVYKRMESEKQLLLNEGYCRDDINVFKEVLIRIHIVRMK